MRRHQLGAPKFRTPRTLRLEQEYAQIKIFRTESTILDVHATEDPPDRYRFAFHGKSLVPSDNEDGVTIGELQEFEMRIGLDFPRRAPEIRWLTKIVHPNISNGSVCMGNFASNWSPNLRLVELLEVLWDMSRMAIWNPHSAYGKDVSMTWQEMDKKFHFPVDRRPLRDKLFPNDVGSSIVRPEGDEADIVILDDDENTCEFID